MGAVIHGFAKFMHELQASMAETRSIGYTIGP